MANVLQWLGVAFGLGVIALGLSGRDVEQFLMKNTAVVECIARMTDNERASRI